MTTEINTSAAESAEVGAAPSAIDIPKAYEPKAVEERWYPFWVARRYFHAADRSDGKKTFSVVIPPPNVTGSLHMGHALNNTLQDILVRTKRMQGFNVCWMPGTDHAGIATQNVVERQLAKEGTSRLELGRAKFVERIWEWKEQSGNRIVHQLQRLGVSCDWDRQRFTLDVGLSRAVRQVFVDLYRAGLIYRDKRLVNWDVKLHTAISDLEVEQREVKGSLWYLRYPVVGEPGKFIVVATTRPETLFGDAAVAVHPDDERYQSFIGKSVQLPLTDRTIPIVADKHCDPTKGSGAVKITPAHDFNDFEVGRRHNLPRINIFDENAHLNECVPGTYRGLARNAARERVVADLEAAGLIEKIEPHAHTVPYGDRSGEVIEPWLTDQWYVNAQELARPAIAAVKKGDTQFVPKQWEKTFFEWMNNIQPWCISRQLWWGHQIPAWYGPDDEIIVGVDEAEAKALARSRYGAEVELRQDEDVLDTWFSSALWPFSTFGWPDDAIALKTFYPTSVLVTGFDIIFFWVARMMMMGLRFMNQVPFRQVYIHALVRDPLGQKMSKSKGNVIDPLDMMDKYGTDAFRFTLTALAAQGRDVRISDERIEGYRNFCNKIWNAARFLAMQADGEIIDPAESPDPKQLGLADRWLRNRYHTTVTHVTQAIDRFEFDVAARTLYQFVWNDLCDWYLEAIKPRLRLPKGDAGRNASIHTLWSAFEGTLRLLHPFMPFITEELWQRLHALTNDGTGRQSPVASKDTSHGAVTGDRRPATGDAVDPRRSIVTAEWPIAPRLAAFGKEAKQFALIKEIISEIRMMRSVYQVPPSALVVAIVRTDDAVINKLLGTHGHYIRTLARLSRMELRITKVTGKGMAFAVVGDVEIAVPLADIVNLDAERARLEKEVEKIRQNIAGIETKLANPQFIERAPEDIVETDRARVVALRSEVEKLELAMRACS